MVIRREAAPVPTAARNPIALPEARTGDVAFDEGQPMTNSINGLGSFPTVPPEPAHGASASNAAPTDSTFHQRLLDSLGGATASSRRRRLRSAIRPPVSISSRCNRSAATSRRNSRCRSCCSCGSSCSKPIKRLKTCEISATSPAPLICRNDGSAENKPTTSFAKFGSRCRLASARR